MDHISAKGNRRKAREIALQVLFQMDAGDKNLSADEAFALFCKCFDAPRPSRNYAWEIFEGARAHQPEMDELINNASDNWRLDRMNIVDRNILRLALYELLYLADVPVKVTINEAVDLGKTFGSDESGAFINGILDRLHHQLSEAGRLNKLVEEKETPLV